MYTHKSIETIGTLTMLIPIFISFLVASLILFFIMIILKQKNKMINGFTVLSLSAFSIFISGQLLYSSGSLLTRLD